MESSSINADPWTHVQFETSIGAFVIELYYKHAPRTSYNLAALADAKYFDSVLIHRVARGEYVQTGDPTGTGRGGSSIYGQPLQEELTRNLKHTGAGVVAMVDRGSQFYITLKPLPSLDGKHTIFGRVYSGMGVIQRLGMVATDADERPIEPVTIHRARPFRGPPPSKEEQIRLESQAQRLLIESS